jgi:hypothetical protein
MGHTVSLYLESKQRLLRQRKRHAGAQGPHTLEFFLYMVDVDNPSNSYHYVVQKDELASDEVFVLFVLNQILLCDFPMRYILWATWEARGW